VGDRKRIQRRTQGRPREVPELRQLLKVAVLVVLVVVVATSRVVVGDGMSITPLKVLAAATLAFIPGWLFIRFVSVRSRSVWEEYVLNLHRLGIDDIRHLPQPPRNSIYWQQWKDAGGDLHPRQSSIYIQKFEAHYGKGTAAGYGDGRRLRVDAFFPVFLTTLVFALGWVTVLWRDFAFEKPPAFPEDALCFAFMGAYLFSLQALVRRFFQADLKMGAYVSSTVRTATALIVVLGPGLLLQDGSYATFAVACFMVGFFPLVGIQAMQRLTALALRVVVPTLRTTYPLSDLDGLTVWYESRLLELGVEDAQNLATANLVDVLLHSRVPVARLIDWVDQAILYLHLNPQPRGKDKSVPSDRDRLRRLGIRSATALEEAVTLRGDGGPDGKDAQLVERLRWALNEGEEGPSVTDCILKTLARDPNLKHVRHWKQDWRRAEGEAPPPPPAPVRPPAGGASLAAVNGSSTGPPPVAARLS
jgi:hypothetical protein